MHPFAGITQIRFNGYNLRPRYGTTPWRTKYTNRRRGSQVNILTMDVTKAHFANASRNFLLHTRRLIIDVVGDRSRGEDMGIPIVSIVGRSNTGKTTLVEKLVTELKNRGYRVATIKHNLHGFQIDHEGKDSYRHKQAGAVCTVIASSGRVAMVKDLDRDLSIDEIATRFIDGADIIVTEGYKGNDKRKIEVHRREAYADLLCGEGDDLLAIATDTPLSLKVPQYDINDAGGLCDLIESTFLEPTGVPSLSLVVDGSVVPLKPFVHTMVINAIRGLLSGLQGCEDPHEIDIRIRVSKTTAPAGRTDDRL